MGRVNGAAVPLTVVNDGKEVTFLMSPLSDKDLSELTEWVQERYLQTARKSAKNEPREERDRIEQLALATACTLAWTSGIGARMIASPDGMARLIWHGVRKNHPEITVEELRSYMFSAENIRESNRIFRKANDLPESNAKGGPTSKKSRQADKQRSQHRSRKRKCTDASPVSTNSVQKTSQS